MNMSFVINNQIWQLAEKLYIHCYEIDGFVNFLRSHKINLPDDFYSNFEIYSFMSTEQNRFAQFMQRVPSYRYLPILEKIIFDEKIKSTQRDNWNYYGVYIRRWYPELLDQLKQAGLEIDDSNNKIIPRESEAGKIQEKPDFLRYNFNDPFLDYIRKEINENYNNTQYLAVMVLSRKMAECIIIRIFEVVFRKHDSSGVYNEPNHFLWFDKSKNRFQNFGTLLINLKNNSSSFDEDRDFVEEICTLIKPFKDEMNRIVHYDYKIPTKDHVEQWDIPDIFNRLGKLYKKYCNP